ncbi:MAG: hypothetical protein COB59_01620 [Rhodospirillaceae bacterium]|nr:MAG: hypothetical protein COB59_01620 [Rhodospirillaceae bacterium]
MRKLRARGAFDEPQDCLDAKQTWLNSAPPLTAFINERCSSNADAFVPIKALYEALKFWAEECGIRKIPTRNTVKANLEGLGYTVQRRDAGNAVYGLELNGSHFGEP